MPLARGQSWIKCTTGGQPPGRGRRQLPGLIEAEEPMSQPSTEPKNSADAVRRVLTTAGITGAALTLSAAAALPAFACHGGGNGDDSKQSSSQSSQSSHQSKGSGDSKDSESHDTKSHDTGAT